MILKRRSFAKQRAPIAILLFIEQAHGLRDLGHGSAPKKELTVISYIDAASAQLGPSGRRAKYDPGTRLR
jgi:hypothetical protein